MQSGIPDLTAWAEPKLIILAMCYSLAAATDQRNECMCECRERQGSSLLQGEPFPLCLSVLTMHCDKPRFKALRAHCKTSKAFRSSSFFFPGRQFNFVFHLLFQMIFHQTWEKKFLALPSFFVCSSAPWEREKDGANRRGFLQSKTRPPETVARPQVWLLLSIQRPLALWRESVWPWTETLKGKAVWARRHGLADARLDGVKVGANLGTDAQVRISRVSIMSFHLLFTFSHSAREKKMGAETSLIYDSTSEAKTRWAGTYKWEQTNQPTNQGVFCLPKQ